MEARAGSAAPAAAIHGSFYREGEFWTVAYAGTVVRLRDAKGLHCLAHLLRNPGNQFAAFELLEVPRPRPLALEGRTTANRRPDASPEQARVVVTKRIRAAINKIAAHHPALGYHLKGAVKTGGLCTYVPDPVTPIAWTEQKMH